MPRFEDDKYATRSVEFVVFKMSDYLSKRYFNILWIGIRALNLHSGTCADFRPCRKRSASVDSDLTAHCSRGEHKTAADGEKGRRRWPGNLSPDVQEQRSWISFSEIVISIKHLFFKRIERKLL